MLDIKIIRENPDKVKAALKTRNADYDSYIDEILEIDEKRRKLSTETDALKAEQNKVSKQIPIMKKNGENTDAVMAEMKEISEKIKNDNAVISELETKQRDTLLRIPNIPSETTPIGKDDSENVELRKWGEPVSYTHLDVYKRQEASDGIIANERQKNCIEKALSNAIEAKTILENGEMLDAVTVMLDSAADNLMELTGEKSSEKVIDDVFSRFCVGK